MSDFNALITGVAKNRRTTDELTDTDTTEYRQYKKIATYTRRRRRSTKLKLATHTQEKVRHAGESACVLIGGIAVTFIIKLCM